jgi:hypothetical protein
MDVFLSYSHVSERLAINAAWDEFRHWTPRQERRAKRRAAHHDSRDFGDAGVDLLADSAVGTVALQCKSFGRARVGDLLAWVRSAADGEALDSLNQFWALFDSLETTRPSQQYLTQNWGISGKTKPPDHIGIVDGQHRLLGLSDIREIWKEIEAELSSTSDGFASYEEAASLVTARLKLEVLKRSRVAFASFPPALIRAPSTCVWVHNFVLWTGISPPHGLANANLFEICAFDEPINVENNCDLFWRRSYRRRGARAHRAADPRRYCPTSRTSARHSGGRHDVGRGALCRTGSCREEGRHKTSSALSARPREVVDRFRLGKKGCIRRAVGKAVSTTACVN